MRPKKLMRRPSESVSGFTLIELLIVVAILGILASIAIPNYMKAREKARFTQCVQALTGVKVAMEMFITDHGDYDLSIGTTRPNALSMYMIPGCTTESGSDCDGQVASRVGSNCDFTAIGEWIQLPTNYSYELYGDARDRWGCEICVSPAGYEPQDYSKCNEAYTRICP